MIPTRLELGSGPRHLLAIGCHADDIEIGLGGTLLSLHERHPELGLTWVVLSAEGEREQEARTSAESFFEGNGRKPTLVVKSFPDSFFPYVGGEIKTFFQELHRQVEPDIVFTHASTDAHQDHRLVAELTWNTFRDHLILEYEIPKYDGDLGRPNVFVPLSEQVVARKVELLLRNFPSQLDKHWFTEDLFRATMRLRGVEAATTFAEGFRCRKLVLSS